MKKNSPRRKIVDAIDFLTGDVQEQAILEIDIESIVEFSDHPFHLYEGKRLDDMVESIKNNGILTPVILRVLSPGKYEMLAGHNRMNAARLAGFKTVPAFIKENLTDEEAYIYVIETNLMQRSFNDLYPSEKAVVLAMRFEKVSSQGKRTDILREIKALENGEINEPDEELIDSRGRIGKDYDLSGRTIGRLLRINELTEEWKLDVDNNEIGFMTGVEISYIPLELQVHLHNGCAQFGRKLSLRDAKEIKELNKSGELSEAVISKFILDKEKKIVQVKNYRKIKISNGVIEKYFSKVSSKDMEEIIERAIEQYFNEQG